jgi:uncharacterized protein (DUF488 family)
MNRDKNTVFTIGHSTRPAEDFVALLKEREVTCVIDIRTIPRSRHNPQFNGDALPDTLSQAGLSYQHMAGLGGLRHGHPNSPNSGWRNASFRGFADYMQTPEFCHNLEALIGLAQKEVIALMCAEAVPWRCHRSLIADALVVRGITVEHILSRTGCRTHVLTPWARVSGNDITYPSPDVLNAAEAHPVERGPSE